MTTVGMSSSPMPPATTPRRQGLETAAISWFAHLLVESLEISGSVPGAVQDLSRAGCAAPTLHGKDRPEIFKPSLDLRQRIESPLGAVPHQRDGRPDNPIGEPRQLRRFKYQIEIAHARQAPARLCDRFTIR